MAIVSPAFTFFGQPFRAMLWLLLALAGTLEPVRAHERRIDLDRFRAKIEHYKKTSVPIEATLRLRDYGDRGATTLLRCLDFDNPSTEAGYNWSLVQWQTSLQNPLFVPWNFDRKRPGTPEEIAQNRDLLHRVQAWLDYCQEHPQPEIAPYPSHEEVQKRFGDQVGRMRVRARALRTAWPEGILQPIEVVAEYYIPPTVRESADKRRPEEGWLPYRTKPGVVEIEVNGEWFALATDANLSLSQFWDVRFPYEFDYLPIDARWRRKSDGQPLKLTPGNYTIRVGISLSKAEDRRLAMSLPIEVAVIATDAD